MKFPGVYSWGRLPGLLAISLGFVICWLSGISLVIPCACVLVARGVLEVWFCWYE